MIVVVPMAGRGKRLADSGFDKPKPLIEISGKPILYWALKSIDQFPYSQIIFIALQEHEEKYKLSQVIKGLISTEFRLILLEEVTEGQLCTVLSARDYFEEDQDLLIVSSDTYVVSDINQDVCSLSLKTKGLISVANLPGDRWSFARIDEEGKVVEVAEKTRISDFASTGIYYFSNCSQFLSIADDIILSKEKTKGEYYVIPVYQKMIDKGLQINISLAKEMWDLGTPEAIKNFDVFLQNNPTAYEHRYD